MLVLALLATAASADPGWVPIGPNPDLGRSSDVVADPSTPGVLHAVTSTGFATSRDGGRTWKARGRGLGGAALSRIDIHPRDSRLLLARASEGELFRSEDGGATWVRRQPPTVRVSALALDATDRAVVHATGGCEVHRSDDGGRTWRSVRLAPPDDPDDDRCSSGVVIAVDPTDSETVWVGTGEDGTHRSTDGGRTFARVGPSTVTLALHPEQRGTVFITSGSGFGARKSTDGGATWKTILSSGWAIEDFAFDPDDARVMYAASEIGVLRSVDGGDTWNVGDVFARRLSWTTRVIVDPTTAGSLYAAQAGAIVHSADASDTWTLLPGPTTPWVASLVLTPGPRSRLVAAAQRGTLHTSRPGRSRWDAAGGAIPALVTHLALDPTEPSTMYAAGYSPVRSPLFRTVDGGDSWQEDVRFPTGALVNGLAIDPRTPSTLWAAFIDDDRRCHLWRTIDGGASWHPIGGEPAPCLEEIAVDPSNPKVLYAATASPGVAKSVDGGKHWSTLDLDESVLGVAVQPHDPGVVYAVGFGGIHRSDDGGASWRPAGLNDRIVRRLAIDPSRSDTVYAATQFEVYRGRDGAWTELPPLPGEPVIYALLLDPRRRTLFVGTGTGRGVWKLRGAGVVGHSRSVGGGSSPLRAGRDEHPDRSW